MTVADSVLPVVGGPSLPQERRLVTAVPGPRSQELMARRRAVVPAGVGTTLPVFIAAAGGGVLVDVDGNSFIDMGSGIAVVNVGNAAEEVIANVAAQAAAFTHTCFMVTPYEGYVAVCEALSRLTPGDHEKRSFLCNSGAEAVENAVKVARAATGRQAVVVLDHGYHGRTNLTMALTAKEMPYKHSFGPFAPEVYRVPMAYPFRWTGDPDRCGPDGAAAVIDEITRNVGISNVACLIAEPIQGEGGFIVPPPGFLRAVADFCQTNGIVFVADEIQTGFGRTGAWFACEHEGVVPDLVTTAKGLGGGLPLAALTGRADLMDSVHAGGLGGTYGGNPVACAAALGAIRTIEDLDLLAAAAQLGEIMTARLQAIATNDHGVGEVRGRGAMVAVELVEPGTLNPDAARTKALASYCHSEGVVVLTAGSYGNVLRFLPPLVMPTHLLSEAMDVVAAAFEAVPPSGA